ncbi:hypothetical protein [Nocardioides cynanchi]|uniref:hypothetical protein n=1 Tax=Nocardioides cynanchi TaxID=2558918 RepID=UPI00124597CE|nr:hypothetical protein [Nocardioides cynanchi]
METLHERFADLAEEAPDSPTPPNLWVEGRRRARARRVGTAVVVVAILALLSGVGGLAGHRAAAPQYAGQPGEAPALPSQVHHPSPWLSGTGGQPPGQLSMLVPGKRGGWRHYHWGEVGVSATTGSYRYLEIPGCLDVSGLAPDGLHVWCFTGRGSGESEVLIGLAVYDTVTGHLDRWSPPSGRVGLNSVAWSGNDALTFRAGPTSYLWHFRHGDPQPISVHLTSTIGTVGNAGLYQAPHRRGYFYLDPARQRRVETLTLRGGDRVTGTAAVTASGRRVVTTGASGSGRWLLVADVTPHGQVSRFTRVPAAVHWPWLVGWADESHVLVVSQVSPGGSDAPADPGRYALDSVDVETGRTVQVAGMSDQQTSWGAAFATSLLGLPTRDFPAPPEPMDPRLEAGLGAGVLLLGAVALVWWRRRVRP